MKMQRYETLGMYIFAKPKTLTQKEYNAAVMAQAEAIRAMRVQAVINEEFGFLDKEKLNGDFQRGSAAEQQLDELLQTFPYVRRRTLHVPAAQRRPVYPLPGISAERKATGCSRYPPFG